MNTSKYMINLIHASLVTLLTITGHFNLLLIEM